MALNNSGLYNIETTGTLMGIQYGGPGTVNNTGTIEESSSGLSYLGNVTFNNAAGGDIDVASGTLSLNGGGADLGGNFTVSSGALNLTGGSSPNLTGTYTGSGAGSIIVGSGTINIGSAGAIFNFPQSLFQWKSGTINATAGTLTNAATSSLTLSGTSSIYLEGTLNNAGVITQIAASSYNELYFETAVLNNSGLYNIQENGTPLQIGSTSGVVNNTGTFEKTGPSTSGTASLGTISFNEAAAGIINITSGCLSLSGTSTDQDGTITVGSGGTLNLTGTISGVFTASGKGGITVNGGPLYVGSGGATFNFPQGMCVWTEGTINATAGILTIGSVGYLTISGASGLMYLDGTLDNAGIITQIGPLLYFEPGVVNNSGLYNITAAGTLMGIQYGGPGTVNNSGTFEESSSGAAKLGVSFNNAAGGYVDVASGTLSLNGGGTDLGGNFTVNSGVLNLTGGSSPNMTGTYIGSGSGNIIVGSGTLDIVSPGATFNFPQYLFQWSSGTINAAGGLTNAASSTLTLSGTNDIYLIGTLNNAGVINQVAASSYNELYFDGAVLNNSGLYNVEENGTALQLDGSVSGAVNNSGTFEKTGPSTIGKATLGSVSFNNTSAGTINVASGTLSLTGGGTDSGGNFTVGSGVLNLTGGSSPNLTGTYTSSGGGSVILASGTLDIGSSGATFNFPQNLFLWSGGTINATAGALTNAATGYLNLTGAVGYMYLEGTLDNNGTITESGPASDNILYFANAVLNNSSLYEIEGSYGTNLQVVSSDTGAFNNTGTFASASIPTDSPANLGKVSFNNAASGTVNVTTGTLSLSGGGTDSGGNFSIASGAGLSLTGGTLDLNSTISSIMGSFTTNGSLVNFQGGTVGPNYLTMINGTLDVTANSTSGALFHELPGTTTLEGNIIQNMSLIVDADNGNTTLNIPSNSVNAGSVTLTSTAGHDTASVSGSGSLTNSAAGHIYSLPASGGGTDHLVSSD